jgi:hypothetical protein
LQPNPNPTQTSPQEANPPTKTTELVEMVVGWAGSLDPDPGLVYPDLIKDGEILVAGMVLGTGVQKEGTLKVVL